MQVYACNKYTASNAAHATYVECFDQALMKAFPKGLPEGAVNMTFAVSALGACAKAQGIDYSVLDKCSTSTEGEGYFKKEKALTPTHQGVPFVKINGGAIQYNSAKLNLIEAVCAAYTGSPKPAACSKNATQTEEEDHSYTSLISKAY